MISLNRVRILDIAKPPGFIAAASGLVFHNGEFHVIADDQLGLAIFSIKAGEPGRILPLIQGELPADPEARKKVKPDFESICILPEASPSILALPSGSRPNRVIGAVIREKAVQHINLGPLYKRLSKDIKELNLEGSAVAGNEILLLNRGNGKHKENMLVTLDLASVLGDLAGRNEIRAESLKAVSRYDLGSEGKVPFCFTDVAPESPERIWFLAATETGKSTYKDGVYGGGVLGRIGPGRRIEFMQKIECKSKPEGLAIDAARGFFYVVTDGDDPTKPSELLEGRLPS